jgi:hypothetical protein
VAAWRRVGSQRMPWQSDPLQGDPISNHHAVMAATEALAVALARQRLDLQGKGKGEARRACGPACVFGCACKGKGKSSAMMRARDAYKGKGEQLSWAAHTTQAPTTEEPTTEKPTTEEPTTEEHGTGTMSAASPALIGKGGYEAMEPPFPKFSPPPGLSRRTPKLQNAKCTVQMITTDSFNSRSQQKIATADLSRAMSLCHCTVHLQNAEDQRKGAQLTPPTMETTAAPTTEVPSEADVMYYKMRGQCAKCKLYINTDAQGFMLHHPRGWCEYCNEVLD